MVLEKLQRREALERMLEFERLRYERNKEFAERIIVAGLEKIIFKNWV
jgi:hypothetical protein